MNFTQGILNENGLNCYRNAVLQCMYSIKKLVDLFNKTSDLFNENKNILINQRFLFEFIKTLY